MKKIEIVVYVEEDEVEDEAIWDAEEAAKDSLRDAGYEVKKD